MSIVEDRLGALGLQLPPPNPAFANYLGTVRTGNLVFVSGHGPYRDGAFQYVGKLGREIDTPTGREAARLVLLNCLASLKAEIGDLDRVTRIVKLLGMVNAVPDFIETALVINGASDLLVELYGERGRHARAAVGMVTLPFGISVEIEMIVEIAE